MGAQNRSSGRLPAVTCRRSSDAADHRRHGDGRHYSDGSERARECAMLITVTCEAAYHR